MFLCYFKSKINDDTDNDNNTGDGSDYYNYYTYCNANTGNGQTHSDVYYQFKWCHQCSY